MPFTYHEFPHTRNYDSDLRELIQIVRDIEDYLVSLDDVISSLEEALKGIEGMQKAITELQTITSEIPSMRRDIAGLILDNANLHTIVSSLERRLDGIDSRFDLVYEYVDAQDAIIKLRLERYQIETRNELNLIWRKLNEINTTATNPWHYEFGEIPFQRNIGFIYQDLADAVPTAEEYCSLGLTAGQYAAFDLPAYEYATHGKRKLHYYWVFSPVYGWRQEVSNVLSSIVNYERGTMSASDYAALDMTAEEYATLDLTAEEYISYPDLGYVTEAEVQQMIQTALVGTVAYSQAGTGITSEQYAGLEVRV